MKRNTVSIHCPPLLPPSYLKEAEVQGVRGLAQGCPAHEQQNLGLGLGGLCKQAVVKTQTHLLFGYSWPWVKSWMRQVAYLTWPTAITSKVRPASSPFPPSSFPWEDLEHWERWQVRAKEWTRRASRSEAKSCDVGVTSMESCICLRGPTPANGGSTGSSQFNLHHSLLMITMVCKSGERKPG